MRAALAGLLLCGFGVPDCVAAPPASPLAMCWTADDLAAKPDERTSRRLNGALDTRPVSHGLAAFNPIPENLSGSIRRVKLRDGRKLIALTFDLCEEKGSVTGYDGAIVDTLRATGTKATFFAGGKWMLDHEERAQQLISDPLFEIGNHSWDHANVRRLDEMATAGEVRNAQAAYESERANLSERQCLAGNPAALKRVPARIGLFRFPFGTCNPMGMKVAAEQGVLAIQWDVAMADPVLMQSGDRIVKTVLAKVKPGSIIIGHANGRGVHTNDALPVLIPRLKALGYEFVTVSELLAAGEPEIAHECYDSKPGDLDRYDRPKAAAPAVPLAPASNG